MSTPDHFDTLPVDFAVAQVVGQLLDSWMPDYLAALERQAPDLEPGTLNRPAAAKVRHAGIWRRGEQTPAIIVWPEGLIDIDHAPDGQVAATLQLGVLLVAAGPDEDSTTLLAQRYAAATRAILLQRHTPPVDGTSYSLLLQDADYTALDVEDRGRVRAGITLSYHVPNVVIGHRDGGPPPDATPRPDPKPPWPAGPTVKPGGAQATVERSSHPMDPN